MVFFPLGISIEKRTMPFMRIKYKQQHKNSTYPSWMASKGTAIKKWRMLKLFHYYYIRLGVPTISTKKAEPSLGFISV